MQSLNNQQSAVGRKAHRVAVHTMAGHWLPVCVNYAAAPTCKRHSEWRREDAWAICWS